MRAVYEASQDWVRDCLLEDGSLFTPDRAVWSRPVLADLKLRFVDRPDTSKDNFENKFQRQLAGAPPTTVQLAAELIFVYFLASKQVTSVAKRQLIETVLGWSKEPLSVPDRLLPALEDGIAMAGMSFNTRRPFLLWYLLELALRWKDLSHPERSRLAEDPWAFKEFVFASPLKGVQTQQHALLHMVHPDVFEPLTSQARKRDIVEGFRALNDEVSEDVDRRLAAIRAKLTPRHGANFNFWDEGIRERWTRDGDEDSSEGSEASANAGPPASEALIREVMAAILVDESARKQVLTALADVIEAAHALNPRSWVLSARDRGRGGLRLSVGRVYVLAVRPGDVAIAYEPTSLDPALRTDVRRLEPQPFQAESLELVSVPLQEAAAWLARLHEANLAAAKRAARAKGSPYARHHSPNAVRYLRAELGRELPDPERETPTLVRETPTPHAVVVAARPQHGEVRPAFSLRAFELLAKLHAQPRRELLVELGPALREEVIEPFRALFLRATTQLRDEVPGLLETERRLFGRFEKNDYGRGGAWDYYWGALYLRGGSRVSGLQLFARIDHDRLSYGFDFGDRTTTDVQRFAERAARVPRPLARVLAQRFTELGLVVGARPAPSADPVSGSSSSSGPSAEEWLGNVSAFGPKISAVLSPDEVRARSADVLAGQISKAFEALFPLVLLATQEDATGTIEDYLTSDDDDLAEQEAVAFSLEQVAAETGHDVTELQTWVAAIERKGQAILYGPPGTGKTYLAERLARHLVGGGNGVIQLVQFHPAYAYEDFIQGIRPRVTGGSAVNFDLVRGRFLEFCRIARERMGRSVLIIDEINRANLSRVFGELMYLLEYREQSVPLAAGGEFSIPANVRLIGTMNTADRSIALVDHALRRRFAFLALKPDYDVLRHYHESLSNGFEVEELIEVLRALNEAIGDPHYEVGITFFLRPELGSELEHIWKMEIEPYVEEFFFDQPAKAREFRWDKVQSRLGG